MVILLFPFPSHPQCIKITMTSLVAANVANVAMGPQSYFKKKIEELEITINEKSQNLRRLQAQRNALNSQGTL